MDGTHAVQVTLNGQDFSTNSRAFFSFFGEPVIASVFPAGGFFSPDITQPEHTLVSVQVGFLCLPAVLEFLKLLRFSAGYASCFVSYSVVCDAPPQQLILCFSSAQGSGFSGHDERTLVRFGPLSELILEARRI